MTIVVTLDLVPSPEPSLTESIVSGDKNVQTAHNVKENYHQPLSSFTPDFFPAALCLSVTS